MSETQRRYVIPNILTNNLRIHSTKKHYAKMWKCRHDQRDRFGVSLPLSCAVLPHLFYCFVFSPRFLLDNVFSPSEPSEGDALLAMSTSLFITSVGLAIIYFQCLKLRQRFRGIRERRQQTRRPQASNLLQSSLRDVCGEARTRQEESVQSLKAELESMKELHATVKAQVEGLQQLLGRITGEDGVPYGKYGGLDDEKENLTTLQDSHDDVNQRLSQVHSKVD